MEQHMWRRYGDAFYTLITFGFFGFETIALGGLSIAFLLGRTSGIVATPLEGVLFAVVTSTASALALLGLYLLVYRFVSALRDRWHEERLDTWTERWITLALEDATGQGTAGGGPAQRRLPPAAVEAVLRLLEAVKGEEGDRLKSVLSDHQVDRSMLRRLRAGHLAARLDAIESLGRARLPQALDALLELLKHPRQVIRRMAIRAAAGTLAIMPQEPGHNEARAKFIHALKQTTLRAGVIQEALLLLETRAGPVLRDLLDEPDLSDSLRWVVLETIGRLGLADMAGDVAASLTHRDPELRAAALRALHRLGTVPETSQRQLYDALGDEVDFVRVQAAHAAAFAPADTALPALWPLLEDDSWWVRRAAAGAMARLGDEGVERVKRAARTHPDEAARDMAVQILLEAGELEPADARLVKGVA